MPEKYHIALSFAGEDRDYVRQVAKNLSGEGVDVFYDEFEEANLWGKDLYVHLSDVYQKKAIFTVMFISEHYKNKLWTNHERQNAQARAFSESREYILPAFFDTSVEVPGLLKTTGYINLAGRTPEQMALLIVEKLKKAGVRLASQAAYSDEARADVDFPLVKGDPFADIVSELKSYNWYTQSPAVERLIELDWTKLKPDQIFVLGRNLYQSACGSERKALKFLGDLRKELAKLPNGASEHFLNGMFYEVYFNSKGEFREGKIKGQCLEQLLKLQAVKRYESSIQFIRRSLRPYQSNLPFLPNTTPEAVSIEVVLKKTDPPVVKTLKLNSRNILSADGEDVDPGDHVWKLSYTSFTLGELKERLSEAWSIPLSRISIDCQEKIESDAEVELAKGVVVRWPKSKS